MKRISILILGHRSFAAKGLETLLKNDKYEVDCYSRGDEKIEGRVISGDVFKIGSNNYFRDHYDIVINFILIKNEGIDQNLKFIKVLADFCQQKSVNRFFQISSISVYSNELNYVNENTIIESDGNKKGAYASIKIAVDQYLLGLKDRPFELTFLRPGFIVSKDVPSSFAGISINLPFNSCLLLGNKATSLPLVDRDKMHLAIEKVIRSDKNEPVYLFFENNGGTKYLYFKNRSNRNLFLLPKIIIIPLAKLLMFVSILDQRKFLQIKGLFKSTKFDSANTERILNIKF